MKIIAALFLIAGLFTLADAVRDQTRGIADVRGPKGSFRREIADRAKDPERFRSLMSYQWTRAALLLGASMLVFSIGRRANRTDPFLTSG